MNAGDTWFKAFRSDEAWELMKANKNAFVLLWVIASRARRTNAYNANTLRVGQAFLGDYHNYGMTEQEYRTAKKLLERDGFAVFEASRRGTIATLLNSQVFDINPESNGQGNGQLNGLASAVSATTAGSYAGINNKANRLSNGLANSQLTTNKNGKNENNKNRLLDDLGREGLKENTNATEPDNNLPSKQNSSLPKPNAFRIFQAFTVQ